MMDWITARRLRLPILLGCYFAVHVIVRVCQSSSLSFDESEQVFLSQYFAWGYNSQPPLFTWLTTGLFEVLGHSIVPIALLKNALLFLTYLLVFAAVIKVTGDSRLAAVASLGMFTIPQIAWESHRDLSHTVGATCATTLLFYCVIGLAKERRESWMLVWYTLIGVAVGVGGMFKYNFVIVAFGFIIAALTIREYRRLILDRRILVSVALAASIVLPHSIWMLRHAHLASEKTLTTLTTNQSEYWFENVTLGIGAISLSIIACCGITLAVFFALYVRRLPQSDRNHVLQAACGNVPRLLERFLLAIAIMLALIVLTGHAVEFKDRWLQPFVCLVPAYLALRFAPHVLRRERAMNLAMAGTLTTMVIVLSAVIARPMVGSHRGKYSWLNIPYGEAASEIRDRYHGSPFAIVASDMRVAGNFRLHFPEARVISLDFLDRDSILASHPAPAGATVLLVSSLDMPGAWRSLSEAADESFSLPDTRPAPWIKVDVDYLYGKNGDYARFCCSELHLLDGSSNQHASVDRGAERVARSREASQH